MDAAIDLTLEQASGPKHAKVLGDGGKGHGEQRGQGFDRRFAFRQPGQDGAPGRIGKGAKGRVQQVFGNGQRIVNHLVYYCTQTRRCQV